MLTAVGFNLITFQYIIKSKTKPLYSDKLELPTNTVIDIKLIIGAIMFGIGWGISNLCPGPAIALVSLFSIEISIIFLLFLALG